MHALSAAAVLLAGLCSTGLCFALLRALSSGAARYEGDYSARTAHALEDLFLFVPPRRIAEAAWIAGAVAAFLAFLALGAFSGGGAQVAVRALFSLALGALMLLAPGRLLALLRARRRARLEAQLADALPDMGNALRSGFSILQAVEHVAENGEAPIAQEFATLLHQTRVGVPFEEALRNMDARVGSEDLSLAALSIETARRTGGNLAEVFDNIAGTIRERIRIRGRVRTLTAQGRLQGVVLSLMPVLVGLGLHVLEPGLFGPFLHSATGLAVLAATAALLVLGALSIRKIVRIDV
ncbi:MAG: type II secretion system F family protein [Kiritimatiellae bacterium]|nr:type II secretion system F family protein [Kiritimatiellia bacterium]